MKTKTSLHLKDLAVPGLLILMWALFLIWYGDTF
jgi:hypothetical protein